MLPLVQRKLFAVHAVVIVVGAALMAAGIGFFIATSLQLSELQFEVNGRLPEALKFEPLFWSFDRLMRLRDLQKTVLPQSPRPKKAMRFAAIGFSAFFLGVALLFFGMKGFYN